MENLQEIKEKLEVFIEKVCVFQLEEREKDFTVETKSTESDFVTSVDRKSDEMIIDFIQKNYPTHQILTEENGVLGQESRWRWIVDPIDGTTNFVRKYPLHSISVGLEYDGEMVLGYVALPVLNMRFWAIKGQGAYLGDKRIKVSSIDTLRHSVLSTGFPYDRVKSNPTLPYFNKIINKITGIRRTGSAAIDVCFCAAGYIEGYFEFRINKWDYAAGEIILQEAGGAFKQVKVGEDTMCIFTNSLVDEELHELFFE